MKFLESQENFPALIDEIAGAPKDMQHARATGICQPVAGIGGNRIRINGQNYVPSLFSQQTFPARSVRAAGAILTHWDFPPTPIDHNTRTS